MARHHRHHKQKSNENKNEKGKKLLFNLKWFIIWVIIYSALYLILNFLLKEMFGQYDFFKVKIVYILLIGLFFSVISRIIYDLIKKKRVYMGSDVFIFWTLTYGLSIWFFEFLWELIVKRFQNTNPIISFIFIGLGVAVIIKLVKRIEFGIKQPSQIMTGVLLMFLGILFFRFSNIIFSAFWPEGMAWSWLFGLALLIGGFLMIIAWWRNNVSMFTTKHTVHWKK